MILTDRHPKITVTVSIPNNSINPQRFSYPEVSPINGRINRHSQLSPGERGEPGVCLMGDTFRAGTWLIHNKLPG